MHGQEILNLAFVANLFNNHPGLDPPTEEVNIIQETREEKVSTGNMNVGVALLQLCVTFAYNDRYIQGNIYVVLKFCKTFLVVNLSA